MSIYNNFSDNFGDNEKLMGRLSHLLQQTEKVENQKYKEAFYHRKKGVTAENFDELLQSNVQLVNYRPVKGSAQNCAAMGTITASAQFTVMVDVMKNNKLSYTTAISILSKDYANIVNVVECLFIDPEIMSGCIHPLAKDDKGNVEYFFYFDAPLLILTNVLPFLEDFRPLLGGRTMELDAFSDAVKLLYQTKGRLSKHQLEAFLESQHILTLTGRDVSMLTHPRGYYEKYVQGPDVPKQALPGPLEMDPKAVLPYLDYVKLQIRDQK